MSNIRALSRSDTSPFFFFFFFAVCHALRKTGGKGGGMSTVTVSFLNTLFCLRRKTIANSIEGSDVNNVVIGGRFTNNEIPLLLSSLYLSNDGGTAAASSEVRVLSDSWLFRFQRQTGFGSLPLVWRHQE